MRDTSRDFALCTAWEYVFSPASFIICPFMIRMIPAQAGLIEDVMLFSDVPSLPLQSRKETTSLVLRRATDESEYREPLSN